ncbi:puratrophin-1 isoform X1 [Paramisgurnus dabryanus]|uniref:puratrophin-1 isoform X1 n=1 Tax=Paramisgurnus dabryanus TaxID=90735 RepID=UPI0031F45743
MASSAPSKQQDSLSLCPATAPLKYSVETRIRPARDGIAVSLRLVDNSISSRESEMDQLGMRPVGWVSPSTWDSRSVVGNHDDLRNLNREPQGTSSQPQTSQLRSNLADPSNGTGRDRTACVRTVRFAEEPCTPCMQRKHGKGTKDCRYRKSYIEAQEKPINPPKRPELPNEPVSDHRSLHKSARETPEMCQQSNSSHFSIDGQRDWTLNISPDTTDNSKDTVSFTPPVVGTSEKCHIVIRGQPNDVNRDSYLEMIPRLHVVPGKKATVFGLVSPKINRRRMLKQDETKDSETLSPPVSGPQMHFPDIQSQNDKETLASASLSFKADTLLYSGVVCLTGGQDRSGRTVLEMYGDHPIWGSALISSQDLYKLLVYLHTISRKETKDDGTTIVFDARKMPLHPEFTKALLMVQENNPDAVHCLLLLVNKDNNHSYEKRPGVKIETVSSFKALYKLIDIHQLTAALQGSLPYNHSEWTEIHQKLYPFVSDLRDASDLLTEAIKKLEGVHKIDTVQDVQQCILEHRTLMKNVLEDTRLVALQRGGGAMLARLRWETDMRSSNSEHSCKVIDTVTHLYNGMEEQVHVLARKSNIALQHLDFVLHLREMESRFIEIKEWFDTEGESRLRQAEAVDESSEKIQQTLQSFKDFLNEANERKHQAMMLVSDAENVQGPNYPEMEVFHKMVSTLKSSLVDFLSRAELCCEELATMVYICHFCERASAVASDCKRFLEQEEFWFTSDEMSWTHLQMYLQRLDEFSPEHFQDVREQACCLSSSRALQVWNAAWLYYHEVRQQLEEKLILLEAQQISSLTLTPGGHHSEWPEMPPGEGAEPKSELPIPDPVEHDRDPSELSERRSSRARDRDSIHVNVSCFNFKSDHKSRKVSKTAQAAKENPVDCVQEGKHIGRNAAHDQKPIAGSSTVGCQWFPWQKNSKAYSRPELQITEPNVFQNQQQYQDKPNGSLCPETACDETDGGQDVSTFGGSWRTAKENTSKSTSESQSRNMKFHRIMNELLQTEVEYVRSLGYILTHYFPLLTRPDVPQDLRGQRGRIFGNLEKLYDFHSQSFQQDLETCRAEPLRVGQCFLKHRESFGLYALYSKNKPQSDTLIQHHKYFKRKQMELGDSMDLSSYLLKPIQRISKYSLLLLEILEDCVPDQCGEREEIQAALEVIRFQLRHGNDLLTMDAIRDCDLNLNEQGKLIRQDELWVIFRKKRSLRRVFLFQDVILFTKTKKNHRGDDVYVYKLSIKTCEIGMTHSCGQRGLCFEIWFRRRRSQDTYILQAATRDIKEAWTRDLERILWEQALKSRELRRQERAFMGMVWKPPVDVQPSTAANNNHNANGDITGKETVGLQKTPNPVVSGLQRGVAFTRPESIGSGSTTSTVGSYTSSSSGRGSMSPSTFLGKYDVMESHAENRGLFGYTDRNRPLGRRASVPSSIHSRSSGPVAFPTCLTYSSPALSRRKLSAGFISQTDAQSPLKFQEPIQMKPSTEV